MWVHRRSTAGCYQLPMMWRGASILPGQVQLAILRSSRPAIGIGTLEMGLLANFKIRTKIFVALLPLAVMVIVAALYASIEMNEIDTLYSDLIGKDVKALHNLTVARGLNNRFGQLLYQEIAEP